MDLTETPVQPAHPWWRRNLLALVLGAAVVVLAAVLLVVLLPRGGPAAATQTVTVKFHLDDYDTAYAGCHGQGGYSDIGPGTPVTVRNASGEVLGAAALGAGKASSNGVQASSCDWTVTIDGVRSGESFYSAEVGKRGAITKPGGDLTGNGWTFDVSLGSL